MSTELGTWLRGQRQSRSWNVPEMTRQLRRAATAAGDKLPANECLYTMIRRWERGETGVSERYMLHYCKAFGIEPDQFGPGEPDPIPQPLPHRSGTGTAAAISRAVLVPWRALVPGVTTPAALPGLAYRWIQQPDTGGSGIEREVLMAAHEGGDHAERAERRDIGDATLDQIRADLTRLSREFVTGEPLPVFREMRQVRGRTYAALDRRLWPRDQTDLYFFAGCLNCLMAPAAQDLGFPHAAEELIRAGWAYATAIDHRPLMGFLRMELASVAYWQNRPRQAQEFASDGLRYLADGPNAGQLHLHVARAAARLGDGDTTRREISAAHEARSHDYHDDLLALEGEFAISLATHHYFAGSALTDIEGADAEAIAELERAASLYAAGPGPDEQHGYGCKAISHIDLATVLLRAGELDAAAATLAPVLSLPAGQRINALPERLIRVRSELARSIYQGSALARELDERIEQFGNETVMAGLHDLTGGPA